MSVLYPWLALILAAAVVWIPRHTFGIKGWSITKEITHRVAICLVGYAGVFLTGGWLGHAFRWLVGKTGHASEWLTTHAVGWSSVGLIGVLLGVGLAAAVLLGMLPDIVFGGVKLVTAAPMIAIAVFLLPLVVNGIPGSAGETARAATDWMRTFGHNVNSGAWA